MLILHKGSCILNSFFAKHSVILFYFASMVTLLISFFTNAIITNGRITKHLSPISDLQSDLISTYHWFNFLVNISNLNHWKCGFYRCQENISYLTFWKRLCISIDFQVLSCNVEIKSLSLPSPVEIWMEIQIPSGKTSQRIFKIHLHHRRMQFSFSWRMLLWSVPLLIFDTFSHMFKNRAFFIRSQQSKGSPLFVS